MPLRSECQIINLSVLVISLINHYLLYSPALDLHERELARNALIL